jgi:hypothetical protein
MRFEKPHSLSYQAKTLAMSPSTTLVRGASTIEEAGLPRKSIETSSSSVTSRMPFMGPAAAFLRAPLMSSADAFFESRHVRSTTETLGVGTRMAAPSSLPFSSGMAR